jgi:hypothetical protein
VLGLCEEAGLVRAGVIAVDGSKFAAAASDSAVRAYEEIAAEILAEAARTDAAEGERYGARRWAAGAAHKPRGTASLAAGRKAGLEAERAGQAGAGSAGAGKRLRSATVGLSRTGAPSTGQTVPSSLMSMR